MDVVPMFPGASTDDIQASEVELWLVREANAYSKHGESTTASILRALAADVRVARGAVSGTDEPCSCGTHGPDGCFEHDADNAIRARAVCEIRALAVAERERAPQGGQAVTNVRTRALARRLTDPHAQALTTQDRDGNVIPPTCAYCGKAAALCTGTR